MAFQMLVKQACTDPKLHFFLQFPSFVEATDEQVGISIFYVLISVVLCSFDRVVSQLDQHNIHSNSILYIGSFIILN